MINDRGNKKWTAIMIPEHVAMLKEVKKEYYAVEKPILDEQQIEENGFKLMMAHKDILLIEVKHYKDYGLHHCKGYIDSINYQYKYIKLVSKLGHDNLIKIKFEDTINVSIL
ncbi:YolD-like family protein [Oceanobacillus sp. CFH 90083]|uniref:YolD-like family protein n=1 Tax=Oceanobacillus sp. CFH 90083 TaxID=2592336 RepID=UPI00128CD6DE|nr:YolD-like family protein [Oceanobacillus sp. CFH 90083]